MRFQHITPILNSSNIVASINYYKNVLGFENSWEWGSIPDFGGVSKDGVEIFFCLNGQGQSGTWLSIFVNNVDEMYEAIKTRGAKIISPPQSMEWGVREMLVEDPDGHRIRFGHGIASPHRESSSSQLPATVKIIERTPSPLELSQLIHAVGWKTTEATSQDEIPSSAIEYVVVAEDSGSGKLIGCAFLLGDKTDFYYIKNVIVDPAWQRKRVGSAMMQRISDWLDGHAPNHSFVGLHTGENLAGFYRGYGFKEAFGMMRRIRKD